MLDQTYKNIELIVVDAFSKDNTLSVAKRFADRVISLAAERSPARNLGAKKASGAFLFFIDSDMELTPCVIEECVTICTRRNAHAVIVPEESVGECFLAKCKETEKMMHLRQVYCEAPRFFRRESFDFIGGYDESLVIGEDFELTQRLHKVRFRTERCEAVIKHHEERLSARKLAVKLYYYGKTLPIYARKEPALALKTSSPAPFFRNLFLLKKRPTYFVGLCALKLIEYVAYLSGAFAYVLIKVTSRQGGQI